MKTTLRRISYFLAFLSLVMGGVHYLRVRSARGIILRGVKSISEGLSPALAVIGFFGAGMAAVANAPVAAAAAVTGALLQARYIRHVTRPHRAFEDLFGEDWQQRMATKIPSCHHNALLQHRWSWRMPRTLAKVRWQRNIVYRSVPGAEPAINLRCDLWLPPEGMTTTGISVLYVHGGGYYTTRKDFGTRSFFRHLAAQGHVVMDIDYRLAPQGNLFDMLDDVQYAIAWLKDHGPALGANPERIVLNGGSAGAHLVLMAAYAHNHPDLTPADLRGRDLSVHGVVSYYGVIDMAAAYRRMKVLFTNMIRRPIPDHLFQRPIVRRAVSIAAWVRGVEPEALQEYMHQNQTVLSRGIEKAIGDLVGGSPDDCPEVYRLLSPLEYAGANCPATLLFQGAHDYLLPVSVAKQLHEKLRKAGVPSVYVELAQTEHTFDQFLPEFSPPAQSALYDMERFLAMIA